jgi:ribosomal protein L7/L12
LRRQNKALALLESSEFDEILRQVARSGGREFSNPCDQVNVDLLCKKLIEHGCVQEDIPFLLNALELDIPARWLNAKDSPTTTQALIIDPIEEDTTSHPDHSWIEMRNKYQFSAAAEFLPKLASKQTSEPRSQVGPLDTATIGGRTILREQQIVEELMQFLDEGEMALVSSLHLSFRELADLRTYMAANRGVFKVTKNTLMRRAIDGDNPETPQEEEQTEFDVVLESFVRSERIKLIRVIHEITGLSLREAKALVEAAPKAVKEGIKKEDAEALKKIIEAAGGGVVIK